MRRQARPFIVEVKRKRGGQAQNRSIWSGIDLSAITAEEGGAQQTREFADLQRIDSGSAFIDFEGDQKNVQEEQCVVDRKETVSVPTPAEVHVARKKPKATTKASRTKVGHRAKRSDRKSVADSGAATVQSSAAVRTRKIYSANERAQKLEQIETLIGRGESVANATRRASISEQTYYQWKKAAAPAADGDDLKDLVALEDENKRLKNMLAQRLRKENAELKKKLGIV